LSVIRPSVSKYLTFDVIDFPATSWAYNATDIVALVSSIRAIGLLNPLTVVERNGRYLLIAGRHRLEALRLIGEERVPVRVVEMDDVEARMWTISENLHRTELHPVHRAEQIAEYAKLTKERLEAQKQAPVEVQQAGCEVPGQFAQRVLTSASKPNDTGKSAAARELGITREEVRRSETIAALPDEVKARAVELGRGGTQAALLRAAKAPTPEAQIAMLERRAEGPSQPGAKPLRNLENIAAGELARWIKLTTPNSRTHVIRLLQDCAAILEDELQGISKVNDAVARLGIETNGGPAHG
jgi:ParB-like chromosome segregation protein Spo0J